MRKETEIQSAILDYLQLKGYFYWRENNVPIFDPTKKRFRKSPKGFKKGVPDIFVLKGHYTYALEVKSGEGRQTPEQKEFENAWKRSDFRYYYVVRSVEAVMWLFERR